MSRFRDTAKKYNLAINESKTFLSTTVINILGYCVSHSVIKSDPDRLQAFMELPPLLSYKSLQRTIGVFAYHSKWIHKFLEKINPLSDCKVFLTEGEALTTFENLKKELGKVALQNIDEDNPCVVKCDASEVAVSATLNQDGRPVTFMPRKFEIHELRYPSVEKEATAIIESVRKWEKLLRCKYSKFITDPS